MSEHADVPNVWMELELVMADFDAAFHVDCSSGCGWSGQLRLTLTNPENEPSRSMTFFYAGAADPEDVAWAVLADFAAWMEESGVTPMPVPDWMKGDGEFLPFCSESCQARAGEES